MSRRVPPIRTPGLDHKKIILEDSAARIGEVKRFNKRLRIGLALVVLSCLAMSTYYFSNVWKQENAKLETRLETYTELRDKTLQRFLTSLETEVTLWSTHPDIVKDAKRFITDWHEFSPQEISDIRREYIDGIAPPSLSAAHQDYNAFHAAIHPTLKQFLTHHGYYDVFIFDLDGNLVYSVEKEDDFGYNFASDGSVYASSGLGEVFRSGMAATDPDTVSFVDFKSYAPSNGDPAAFLSSPIVDTDGTRIGIYAIQIPIDKFNAVLNHSQGLGETGESYLVGEDMIMRSQSRLTKEPTMLVRRIDNNAVKAALAGERAITKSTNIIGNASIVTAMPLSFKGVKYAVATEMEIREKRSPLRPYVTFFLASILFLFAFGLVAYAILRARINRLDASYQGPDAS